MSTKVFRCPGCTAQPCDVSFDAEGYELSVCCDEYAETLWMCETCSEREAHAGCDQCLECIIDAVIADPREIDQCAPSLQVEIARELANRLRPFLSRRQAA